uniref:Sulfhydrylase FUB7 ) n=1 Tax=Ganoderma boninense TaxID=34458 RepID=A0A5K1K1Q5_9APHY|nr:Sulfhydrylase FUB7 (EC (Fusaric acid biosynthesis protein 7) [Ganoderma boninense]
MIPPPASNTFYKEPEFETLQLHAGQEIDSATNARAPPIYASTSFVFNNSKHGADLFGLRSLGNIYSRMGNPTVVLTHQFFFLPSTDLSVFLKKFDIGVKFVTDPEPEAFAEVIDDKTKAIYIESIGNPKNTVALLPELAKVAHDHGIPLIVDNTFGMGGKFDWAASGKFPDFTEPAEGYHGMRFVDTFGKAVLAVKCRLDVLRDMGPCMDPFAAFLLLQGLETLSLRAQRHSDNALELARWLEKHPKVAWVSYLGLESHESYLDARRLLRPNAFGGMLTFGVKGDAQVGSEVVDKMKLASNLANVGGCLSRRARRRELGAGVEWALVMLGDAKTLVIHPATTTHQQLSVEEQIASGVTPDLIRVSVGIENISDIIADFDNALKVVP